MFDPFGDFAVAGYLRNVAAEQDLEIVKAAEHELFRAQLPAALGHLARRIRIEYDDFLEVHRIIFGGLYPWAGKDRAELLPDRAVTKGSVFFCHPRDCRRAVQEGLSQAQDKHQMAARPGFIMGMFAHGHPFLDGNGRVMLLVHAELCFRAGMSIDWARTSKTPYLQALTRELEDPRGQHLDAYLRPFLDAPLPRERWLQSAADLPGLGGTGTPMDAAAQYADPEVAQRYKDYEKRRGYRLDESDEPDTKSGEA